MKGVLLSGGRGRSLFKRQDVTYFLHRYGISTILGFSFLLGLIFGALLQEWRLNRAFEVQENSCENCKHGDLDWDEEPCDSCALGHSNWEAME